MASTALAERGTNPLEWQSAAKWIESRNDWTEALVKGFDWCRVGTYGRKHRIELTSHADGRVTIEPACRSPYWGESLERLTPVSPLADGEFCQRPACVHDTPDRRAPRYTPAPNPRQLELEMPF